MSNKPVKKGDQEKPWAKRRQSRSRKPQHLAQRTLFRIYCEGTCTEPEYFRSFPVNPLTARVFAEGFGRSKTALVAHVVSLLRKDGFLPGQKEHDSNRQNWVIFDYDWQGQDRECEDFRAAIALAKRHGLQLAISNDAFEVWLLLHFRHLEVRMHRHTLYEKLTLALGFDYEKEGKTKARAKSLYELLLPFLEVAITRAEVLGQAQAGTDICKQNPSTSVFNLVRELQKNIRK